MRKPDESDPGLIGLVTPHPAHDLDDVVHQRTRLGVLAILSEANQVEFGYIANTLRLTNGNLSRHLQTLEEAGLIDVRKGYEGKRPRTWLSLTTSGRRALDREVMALRALVSRLDGTDSRPRSQPTPPDPNQPAPNASRRARATVQSPKGSKS